MILSLRIHHVGESSARSFSPRPNGRCSYAVLTEQLAPPLQTDVNFMSVTWSAASMVIIGWLDDHAIDVENHLQLYNSTTLQKAA